MGFLAFWPENGFLAGQHRAIQMQGFNRRQ